jgi:hypothetical protein
VPPRESKGDALMVTDSVGGVASAEAERVAVPAGVADAGVVRVNCVCGPPAGSSCCCRSSCVSRRRSIG